MSERAYDEEIAPELRRLSDRCLEMGMPFLAVVEYQPGHRGRTVSGIQDDNLDMRLINSAAAYTSIDDLVIWLLRHVRERRLPHNSIVLSQAGLSPRVEDRG